jgi:hypothetical protein
MVLDFPNNCEPPRDKLMHSHITPNAYHYIRNHGGIPTIQDPSAYSFAVTGLVQREGRLTLDDLKNPDLFEQREVPITLQVRFAYLLVRPAKGYSDRARRSACLVFRDEKDRTDRSLPWDRG